MTNGKNIEMTNGQNSVTVEEEVIAESDSEMTNGKNIEMINDQNSVTVEEEVIAESDNKMTNGLFVLLLYVPIQQLWSLQDGQFT